MLRKSEQPPNARFRAKEALPPSFTASNLSGLDDADESARSPGRDDARFLTLRTAARLLHLHPNTVRGQVRRGIIPE